MSFVISNIYYCGATTLPGKLEFTPSGLTWYCTVDKSDRKIEVRRPLSPTRAPARPSAHRPPLPPPPPPAR